MIMTSGQAACVVRDVAYHVLVGCSCSSCTVVCDLEGLCVDHLRRPGEDRLYFLPLRWSAKKEMTVVCMLVVRSECVGPLPPTSDRALSWGPDQAAHCPMSTIGACSLPLPLRC